MLKLATPQDKNAIISLLLDFHRNSNYAHFPLQWSKMDALIDVFTTDRENKVCILAEHMGEAVGLIAGQISESIFNDDKIASELIWWVDEKHRNSRIGLELFNAFEYWAKRSGCKHIQMVHLQTDKADRIHRLYSKRGYRVAESAYLKEL
jgi:GNAT superfamily N-acetyltransferase